MQGKYEIVIFGDSLCTDFYVSNIPSSMIRARKSANYGGWPKYLKKISAKVYSSVSGHLDPRPPSSRPISRFLLGAKSLDQKIKIFVKNHKTHPRGYYISIGHNNLDWFADINKNKQSFEQHYENYPNEIAINLINSLRRLQNLETTSNNVPIIVSSLVNFEDFFSLRNNMIQNNFDIKYLNLTNEIFPSFLIEHQEKLLRLWRKTNAVLEENIKKYESEFKSKSLKLIYCDQFSKIPINNPKILHHSDAWHLSESGKKYFASYLEPNILENLETSHP